MEMLDGFFKPKTLIHFFAVAIILAAVLVLVSERIFPPKVDEIIMQVDVTRIVPQTVVVTQVFERIITTTPEPVTQTQISQPTATEAIPPTFTHTPIVSELAVLPNGFTAWCMPKEIEYPLGSIAQTGEMPNGALEGILVDGFIELRAQVQDCTFMITFNRPVPLGTRIHIKDMNPIPFIDEELIPVIENPNKGFVTLDHSFIIDPPYWVVEYYISIISPDGEDQWLGSVKMTRGWESNLCPDGTLPDPITLQCP
jgi:hypothetical protein